MHGGDFALEGGIHGRYTSEHQVVTTCTTTMRKKMYKSLLLGHYIDR